MKFSRLTHLLMSLHLETLRSIKRIGLPILVELIDLVNSVNFSISKDLGQTINFPTWIPDFDSHNPTFSDLFFSSAAAICYTMAFLPLKNFNHVVVSVSIDFASYWQWDVLFHRITYEYFRSDWEGFCDNLRDVPLKDIFKCLRCRH